MLESTGTTEKATNSSAHDFIAKNGSKFPLPTQRFSILMNTSVVDGDAVSGTSDAMGGEREENFKFSMHLEC